MRGTHPVDYHVVPREERENHEYNGAQCWCEPRCALWSPAVRIFHHQVHRIDILKVNPSPSAAK